MKTIDINNPDYYLYDKPELNEMIKRRLIRISNAGMQDFGNAQFGVSGVVSGLWIERVWFCCDDNFEDYMIWAEALINKNKSIINKQKGELKMNLKEALEYMAVSRSVSEWNERRSVVKEQLNKDVNLSIIDTCGLIRASLTGDEKKSKDIIERYTRVQESS